ncbi:sugar phosphate antiporter [Psychromonas sp. CNPT3]|uniref:hexose-6-phosphate:phosphate antiporter n=1 Tax=Psychromonas sp. CNPT3 TaxID=314282 RepID=UPI0002C08D96|nr:hexose-6-phosphate:phosphate antiporter [Psychromonas sp. CNPT3]AGH81155.1 sugar phosphate antiporter [Psychromonas sp. CNPT3]
MEIAILKRVRIPLLDLTSAERRKKWLSPFLKSYLVIFVSYMVMYLVRKNFNVAQNDMISDYGMSLTQLGTIGLGFSITYGIGKTALNYWSGGKNSKNMLPLGLLLSGLCILAMGFVMGPGITQFYMMVALYAASGFFQSGGGSNSVVTITNWTPRNRRGLGVGFWNISHNVGGALAAGVAMFGADYFFGGDVKGMFIFPAVIAIVIGILGFFMGNDSPEAYGLGTVEDIFEEPISEEDNAVIEQKLTKMEIFKKYVLFNKIIWILCFANVFLYVVRSGIDQWSMVYAHQVLGFSIEVANSGFTMFEIGALMGTCLWGLLSDLFNGRRGVVSCFALIGVVMTLGFYQHADTIFMYKASLFALGFLVFAPQLLIGVAAIGFVPKQGLAAADGVKGTFAYLIGDSFAKIGLGYIAEGNSFMGLEGWAGTFAAIDAAAIACCVLMAIVAIFEEIKIRKLAKISKKLQQEKVMMS